MHFRVDTLDAFATLDKEIKQVWKEDLEKILKPSYFLQHTSGKYDSVQASVAENPWPKVGSLKGGVWFQLNIYDVKASCADEIYEAIAKGHAEGGKGCCYDKEELKWKDFCLFPRGS